MVVGITGGIGSGKSTVVNFFSKLNGVAVYIADVEAKKLMNTSKVIKQQLIKEFSPTVYKNNQLNRAFLAQIVFNDKEKLAILNAIVHPQVYLHLEAFIKFNANKSYILYENAILFENGSDSYCDKIITVTAPEKERIQRVVRRDKTTVEEVKSRINNQWKDVKKTLQSHYIISNIHLDATQQQVLSIHKKLTKTR